MNTSTHYRAANLPPATDGNASDFHKAFKDLEARRQAAGKLSCSITRMTAAQREARRIGHSKRHIDPYAPNQVGPPPLSPEQEAFAEGLIKLGEEKQGIRHANWWSEPRKD